MTDCFATCVWTPSRTRPLTEFPWRILSVVATLQVLCMSGVFRVLGSAEAWRRAALAGVFLWTAAWCWDQFQGSPRVISDADQQIQDQRRRWLSSFQTYASRDEFTPKAAAELRKTLPPRGDRPLVEVRQEARRVIPLEGHSEYAIHCRVGGGPAAELVIEQLYFPGWRVEVDGRRVADRELQEQIMPDGRMRVRLAAGGPCELRARYAGPPGGSGRVGVMAAFLVLYAAYGWWNRWREPFFRDPRVEREEMTAD